MELFNDADPCAAVEVLLASDLYPHLSDAHLEILFADSTDGNELGDVYPVIELFFSKRTPSELCTIVEALVMTLEVRAHDDEGRARDMSLLHEACVRLIKRTSGASCLNDVVAARRTEVPGVSVDDDRLMAELIADELRHAMHEYETSSGRRWSADEVAFLISRNPDL